jgi:hypothetical protein
VLCLPDTGPAAGELQVHTTDSVLTGGVSTIHSSASGGPEKALQEDESRVLAADSDSDSDSDSDLYLEPPLVQQPPPPPPPQGVPSAEVPPTFPGTAMAIEKQPSMELERHAAEGGLQGPCVPAEDRKVSKMSSKFKRPTPRPSTSALKKQLPAQFASGGRLSAGATPGDGRQSIQSDAATPVFSPFTHAAMSALAGSSLGATPMEPPPTAARLVAAPGSGQVTVSKVEREAPAAATSTDDHGGAAAAGFAAAQTKATTAGRCRQN